MGQGQGPTGKGGPIGRLCRIEERLVEGRGSVGGFAVAVRRLASARWNGQVRIGLLEQGPLAVGGARWRRERRHACRKSAAVSFCSDAIVFAPVKPSRSCKRFPV